MLKLKLQKKRRAKTSNTYKLYLLLLCLIIDLIMQANDIPGSETLVTRSKTTILFESRRAFHFLFIRFDELKELSSMHLVIFILP